MDMIRKNFSSYSVLLSCTGLWPYDKSVIATIGRITYTLLNLSVIGIQLSMIRSVELTSYNITTALSYSVLIFLCLLRYLSFVINFPTIKTVYRNYEENLSILKNPVELDMFRRHMVKGRRLIFMYIVISCGSAVFSITPLMVSTLLHSKYQVGYLRMYGFFVSEQGQKTDLISFHVVIVTVMSFLSVAGTESSLAVFTAYFCGLFEIASYRIENAVNKVLNPVISKSIELEPFLEVHRRAIEMVQYLSKEFTISYLLAVILSIASFAVALNRLLLATNNMRDMENLIFSISLVLLYLIIMSLNNYVGQGVKDSSIQVYYDTYNSLWYCIPPKSQKLLLFLLMRTKDELQYDLAGLFTPCYEGFSMMMSSSFSYFTFLYSTQ
ncbi:uncharacterized protein LOC143259658 [Megalopta genalis]|uniref:uncharacterized protein LOC143259658 n=1 Tax=Megalopta genalis TaxID=115081 RepID=UPI003FD30D20